MATAREGRGGSGRRERRRGRPSRRGRRARGLPRASEPPRGARRAGWSGKGTLVRSLGAPGVERGGIAARTSRKNFLERAFASGRLLEKTGAPAGALRPWLVASRASELRSAIGSGRAKRAPDSRDGDRLAREWEISISHELSGADSRPSSIPPTVRFGTRHLTPRGTPFPLVPRHEQRVGVLAAAGARSARRPPPSPLARAPRRSSPPARTRANPSSRLSFPPGGTRAAADLRLPTPRRLPALAPIPLTPPSPLHPPSRSTATANPPRAPPTSTSRATAPRAPPSPSRRTIRTRCLLTRAR